MTDRFITVPDSLALPAAVKVGVDRLHDSTVAGRALLTGADAAAQRSSLGLGTAATASVGDFATAEQGAKADASDVATITLTAPLALTIPAGFPAGQVYRVTLTQDGTGGHTVTYGGSPVTVDTTAGAVTTVELHPAGAGYVVRYPAKAALGTAATTSAADYATAVQGAKADTAIQSAGLAATAARGALTTIIGSSIARGGDATRGINGAGVTVTGRSWFSWACAISGQRILRGPNCGVIGDTTAMVLARLADVTAQTPKPDNCILYCGSNDAVAGVTPTQYASNVRAITAGLRAAGITPILSTIVPSVNSPEYVTCNTYNTVLKAIARQEGLRLLDFHTLMVDPATGAQLPAYSAGGGDGVHPGPEGYRLMGQYVADTLTPHMPPALVDLVTDPLDPTNLIANGLYQGVVTDGRAASWGEELKPAGTTFSVIEDAAFARGKIQRVAVDAAASRAGIFQYINPPKFAAGDEIEMTCRFRTIFASGCCQLRMDFIGAAAPAYTNLLEIITSGEGTARVRFTVPAGTTSLMVMQRCEAGTATFDLAQMTFRNVTALGIA